MLIVKYKEPICFYMSLNLHFLHKIVWKSVSRSKTRQFHAWNLVICFFKYHIKQILNFNFNCLKQYFSQTLTGCLRFQIVAFRIVFHDIFFQKAPKCAGKNKTVYVYLLFGFMSNKRLKRGGKYGIVCSVPVWPEDSTIQEQGKEGGNSHAKSLSCVCKIRIKHNQ
jgi:hypothetical protein